MGFSFLRFRYPTQRRPTAGRAPLDEWSTSRGDLHLTTLNSHNRQTSMPPEGFEPGISAGERPHTHALDRTATSTSSSTATQLVEFLILASCLFWLISSHGRHVDVIVIANLILGWPLDLRPMPEATRLLRLQVLIPLGALDVCLLWVRVHASEHHVCTGLDLHSFVRKMDEKFVEPNLLPYGNERTNESSGSRLCSCWTFRLGDTWDNTLLIYPITILVQKPWKLLPGEWRYCLTKTLTHVRHLICFLVRCGKAKCKGPPFYAVVCIEWK